MNVLSCWRHHFIHAVTLWRHRCLYTCGNLQNSSVQIAFSHKCKCLSANELFQLVVQPVVQCIRTVMNETAQDWPCSQCSGAMLSAAAVDTESETSTLQQHFPMYSTPPANLYCVYYNTITITSRVVSVLDSGAVGSGFKSQSRRCRLTVLGKLFTPIVPPFMKQHTW